MRWEPPELDNGLPVLVYYVQYALALQHSKTPPPWQSGLSPAETCCQVLIPFSEYESCTSSQLLPVPWLAAAGESMCSSARIASQL